jgi:signal transduction histidine kinase
MPSMRCQKGYSLFASPERLIGYPHLVLVADNGYGITNEASDLILEPFLKTKQDRGTGLGLHILKKIVEAHSGRIRMRSSIMMTP